MTLATPLYHHLPNSAGSWTLVPLVQVIEVPGYTVEEKVEIARRHLLPKQLEQHGLNDRQLEVPPSVLSHIGALSALFSSW